MKNAVFIETEIAPVYTEILWRELLIIAIVVLSQRLGAAVSNLSYICLVFWAMRSPLHAIQALSLSWFLAFLNPGIFPVSGGQTVLRWMVLFSAFSHVPRAFIKHSITIPPAVYFLSLFSIVALLLSAVKSYAFLVSFLKLGIFTIGSVTILFLFELTAEQRMYWKCWFTTLFLLILILGFPLYFSGLGYFRNSTGFQGILSHPQAYAVFIAPMLSWFIVRILFEKEYSLTVIIGAILGFFSLFASESRTGMLAILAGFGLTVFVGFIKRAKWRSILAQTIGSHIAVVVLCLIVAMTILNLAALKTSTTNFLQKRQTQTRLINIYETARGLAIKRSMDNFWNNPVSGIGFGVASDPFHLNVSSDKFFGIPVAAPVEKGTLFSSVLEELGVAGTSFLLMFIFTLAGSIIISDSPSALWLFFTCLMLNMGEMIFFSFGGMGLYVWLLIGFSNILGR